jgi:hypothetical protein
MPNQSVFTGANQQPHPSRPGPKPPIAKTIRPLCHSFSSIILRLKISGSVMLPARLEKQILAGSQPAPNAMELTMRNFLLYLCWG